MFTFTVDGVTTRRAMLGINAAGNNSTASYTDIDYAIYLDISTIWIYENGTNRGSFGAITAGDVYSIAKTGTTITYLRNGAVFYTSNVAATSDDYYFDTSFLDNGANGYTISNMAVIPPSSYSDLDGDLILNSLDLDSDNDGIPDNVEAVATQDYLAPAVNGSGDYIVGANGYHNNYETALDNGTPIAAIATLTDTDGDGISDFLDNNADDDIRTDVIENYSPAVGVTTVGTNGLENSLEGADDYSDVSGAAYDDGLGEFTLADTDTDILANGTDADAANGSDFDYRDNIFDGDTDGDAISDRNDLDDDNDGILDIIEDGVLKNLSLYAGTNVCLLYTSPSPRDRG